MIVPLSLECFSLLREAERRWIVDNSLYHVVESVDLAQCVWYTMHIKSVDAADILLDQLTERTDYFWPLRKILWEYWRSAQSVGGSRLNDGT